MNDADSAPGTSEVARIFRARDWSRTPLGPASTWPVSLRTVLRLMLSSRYAMWMGWGKDLHFFYNDAYAENTLGQKHPWALGTPTAEVWAEIWKDIEPRITHVLQTGEATLDDGLFLFLERNGYPEETYHSFSYSAVPGDAEGEIAGLFCVVVEETGRIINERRLAFLRDLSALLSAVTAPADVFGALLACVTAHGKEFPFASMFRFDGAATAPVGNTGHSSALADHPWPFEELRAKAGTITVALDANEAWPVGPWARPPTHALVLPIPSADGLVGALVLGLNPHRPRDEGLFAFIDLLVGQVAASFARARAHHEQVARAEALAELDRAKTTFFSNVSHELRTPLTLMLGPTQDALASPERALRGPELETVHRNELRLLRLVNALLDFARLEAGRSQAAFQPTDLAALTADLASVFRSAFDRAGLDFSVDCPPLPEPIFVDHDMWEKIVLNLLSNALKFTFEGAVTVSLRWAEDHAELVVRDTGVGVAAAELPRLFERFHRIEGARARNHEGSGIGLALVHELVRLHGGAIAAESEPGRGTTFTITIPPGSAHLPARHLHAERRAATTLAGSGFVDEALRWLPAGSSGNVAPRSREGLPRVLVADDNQDMREYLARTLGQHFNIETAADGDEALAAIRERAPDLVLSDVMMPGTDGFELLRTLRDDPATATLPVILLSARAGEEATAEGLRAGADDYLVKPFSASALLVRVEAQLSARRLRETLRESADAERARLHALFEASPAAIAIFRGDELVLELANTRILGLWNVTAHVIGKPLREAVPLLPSDDFHANARDVLATGVTYHAREYPARLAPPSEGHLERWFDLVVSRLQEPEDGEQGTVVLHAFDVTDKVVARRHVEQLREVAETANRVKDEFLASMSHELRTPLNAILGWATLLRGKSLSDGSAIDRGLATIERNARAQARLIEDVLDVSRIISGKLRLEMAPTDLVAVASAAVDVVRPAADAKGVRLVLHAPEVGPIELQADADRLQQIVWNLLSNAVKFTATGGNVELEITRNDHAAELVVRDSGAGIAAEHLPYVFERFRQADSSSTRKYGGLGLGLAIVRHLVELHGGSATAASDGEGHGAVFTVTLPIRSSIPTGTLEVPVHASAPRSRPSLQRQLEGVTVLVVEDNDDSRHLVANALETAGAKVHAASSAETALTLLAAHPVDVLVSDIGMPDVDGYAFLARVRATEKGAKLPAVALTAYASTADVARAERAGFQRHLAKPADVATVVRLVASLVPPR